MSKSDCCFKRHVKKSKKKYLCAGCGKVILIGSEYNRYAGQYDYSGFGNCHFHISCDGAHGLPE